MKKLRHGVLRLERDSEGVTCRTKEGESIRMPRAALPALSRYFANDEAEVAWIIGELFAPMGSVKKTKLRIVDVVKLESLQW